MASFHAPAVTTQAGPRCPIDSRTPGSGVPSSSVAVPALSSIPSALMTRRGPSPAGSAVASATWRRAWCSELGTALEVMRGSRVVRSASGQVTVTALRAP